MFDALSFAEIDGQHAELLPARTVLSLFSTSGKGGNESAEACSLNQAGLVNVGVGDILNGVLNVLGAGCNAVA